MKKIHILYICLMVIFNYSWNEASGGQGRGIGRGQGSSRGKSDMPLGHLKQLPSADQVKFIKNNPGYVIPPGILKQLSSDAQKEYSTRSGSASAGPSAITTPRSMQTPSGPTLPTTSSSTTPEA